MALSRLKKLLTPNLSDAHGAARGETEISLGCETCPNRQTTTIYSIGEVVLQMSTMVPVEVKQRIDAAGRTALGVRMRVQLDPVVSMNQKPCPGECAYASIIPELAEHLTAAPVVIDGIVEPGSQEF